MGLKSAKPERRRPGRPDSSSSRGATRKPPPRASSSPARHSNSPASPAVKTHNSKPAHDASEGDARLLEPGLEGTPVEPEAAARTARAYDVINASGPKAPARPPLATLGYEERPHRQAHRGPVCSDPEVITIDRSPIGRGTLSAIQEDLAAEAGELALAHPPRPDRGRQARADSGGRPLVSARRPPARPPSTCSATSPSPKSAHAQSRGPGDGAAPPLPPPLSAMAPFPVVKKEDPVLPMPVSTTKSTATPVTRTAIATLGYEERPVEGSSPRPRPPTTSAPELIAIGHAPVGRDTHSAIEQELLTGTPDGPPSHPELEPTVVDSCPRGAPAPRIPDSAIPMPIYEVRTFIVDHDPSSMGADEASRRDFVERRILFRLPALSMKEVAKVEVGPGAKPGTSTLTVWCRVPDRLR